MIINLEYDSRALAAPQSFRDGMQAATNTLDAAFTNNITINIAVGYGEFGGFALPNQNTSEGDIGWTGNGTEGVGIVESYSSLRSLLASHETSTDDQMSVASLPVTSTLQGVSSFIIATAQAKALAVVSANNSAVDGQVGMGTNFTGSVLFNGALHELTHAMGRIAGSSLDLFRYNENGSGNHVFGFDIPATPAYFSIDGGATDLADFGIYSDPGDWLNSGVQGNDDPFDEYVGLGGLSPIDLTLMDVLGFSRAVSPPPPPPSPPPPGGQIIFGGSGNDAMFVGGNDVTVYGGTGSHYINAGDGNDVFIAGSGNDVIVAGNGRDLFYGGSGNDSIYAGSGNDTLIGSSGTSLLEGGGGNDYLYLSDGNGSEAYGGNGNSAFIAGRGNAVMIGGSGNDTMFGGPGNDYFYAGAGNDEMFGGAGVDVMIGGAGDNYFDGGTGVNYYFGGNGGGAGTGLGNNTFVLSDTGTTQSVDVVQDWTEGLDHINLIGTGLTSFQDVLDNSYQNGAYFVIQPDPENAVWLNGATATTLTGSDFSIVS